MSQSVFNDIDPNVTSGTELATLLNDFKDALLTVNSGATAPTYLQVGTQWLDSSVSGKLTMKQYNGTNWISEYTIDTAAHTISFGGNNPTASFTVSRTDTSADMLEMFRNTGVQTNAGLIFSQNNDASEKTTFAKFKMVAENVTDSSEEASFLYEALVAGSLVTLSSVSATTVSFRALEGTGNRAVKVNSSGELYAEAESGEDNIFTNGSAESADLSTFTINSPLTLTKSATSTELIDSSQVFKAISNAASQTFETETIAIPNGFIESPLIVSLKYKAAESWTVEIVDTDAASTIKTVTLDAYSPTLNEVKLYKFFHKLPDTVANIKLVFTSTAADTLLFDTVKIYSWANVDEALHFTHSVTNNVTNEDMFDIANRKNEVLHVQGQVIRETDTNLADGIVSFYISNNGTVFRVGKEDVFDHEDVEIGLSFNMNGNVLRLSSSDITGTNYTGKFIGKITRVL